MLRYILLVYYYNIYNGILTIINLIVLLNNFDCTCRMMKNKPEMSWWEIIDFCQEKQVKITYSLLLMTFITQYLHTYRKLFKTTILLPVLLSL